MAVMIIVLALKNKGFSDGFPAEVYESSLPNDCLSNPVVVAVQN